MNEHISATSPLELFRPNASVAPLDDLYSAYTLGDHDGSWKDTSDNEMLALLEVLRSGTPWEQAVYDFTARTGNHWLRRILLSPSRALITETLPFAGGDSVLDIGSGWGQLSRAIAKQVTQVVSLEESELRLRLNHAISAQEQLENITFVHGSVFSPAFVPKTFNYVVFCGVLEWLLGKDPSDRLERPRTALRIAYETLKPGGYILVAIENRLGLKYLLGERDDHVQLPYLNQLPLNEASKRYEAVTNNPLPARTYSRDELEQLLVDVGFTPDELFLAFPDYKLPQMLIPSTDMQALKRAVEVIGLPPEHEGIAGHPSYVVDELHYASRALGGRETIIDLPPSFVIVARKAP